MHDRRLARPQSRRAALRTVALGGGASLLFARRALAARCDVLLLSCIDYRLVDDLAAFMDARGYRGNYDEIMLAGASLGVLTESHPDWGRTFWEHLDAAVRQNQVKKVMVVDHRDCETYRLLLGEAAVKDAATELRTHTEQLHRLRAQIKSRRPDLEVELGLMDPAGEVETIA
jgi:carbonic anhydrase